MNLHRELDRIVHALETGQHNWFVRFLLHRWKSLLEELIA